MYSELEINGVVYKLRLTTKNSIALEKTLGYNPISMLMEIDNGKMPKLGDMLVMLQAMLQPYHHGMTLDKTFDLFDEFVADGHNMFDLIPIFVEVFQDCGYISKAPAEGTEEKN